MPSLGVVYKFQLRPSGRPASEPVLLGSLDGAGTSLVDHLPTIFDGLVVTRDVEGRVEPQTLVNFNTAVDLGLPGHYAAILNSFRYGERGDLNLVVEGDTIPYTEIDNQRTEIGVVVSARANSRTGFIALHQNNRRSIKADFERAFRQRLREQFGVVASLDPVVPIELVRQAVDDFGIREIEFRKLNNPSDSFAGEAGRWDETDLLAQVNLSMKPRRSERFRSSAVVRYLTGLDEDGQQDPSAFEELATIKGVTYDQLALSVVMSGKPRQVVVEQGSYDMRNAFSFDLGLQDGYSHKELVLALADLIPNNGVTGRD